MSTRKKSTAEPPRARIALLTGFAAFDAEALNPSALIAEALHGATLRDAAGELQVIGAVLPTEFARSLAVLKALIDTHRPDLILALGQAGGRSGMALERVAINLIDARIADNAGDQPIDVAVIDGAPVAYFSRLPLKTLLRELQALAIPAEISHSAGSFVCNHVFFALMHWLATDRSQAIGGFVHVPYLPQQALAHPGAASLPLGAQTEAIRCILMHAFEHETSAPISGGALH